MRKLILTIFLLCGFSQAVSAALFDDKEARQQILDLQQKSDSQNQATKATLDAIQKSQQALEQRVSKIETTLKSQGLVDLLGQVDRLNQELSKVKGQLEVVSHDIEVTQQRQKDLYTDVDGRVRKLESGTPVAASNAATPATQAANPAAISSPENSAEQKDFDAAQALTKAGKHKEAFDAYDKYLQTFPNGKNSPEAMYLLGYSQFSLKNYKAAIATQQKMIKQFPDSPKQPDAYFNIANAQIQLADVDGAKKTLRDLLAKYPESEVAPNAKRRLSVLESIKK
jgi:tol-pal system protein YbgF